MSFSSQSAIGTPRSAESCSRVRSRVRPSIAALARFTGFALPRDFVRMSPMPHADTTARTVAPAMTPVPGDAGSMTTRDAPNRPRTRCGIVLPLVEMATRFLRASLRALLDGLRHLVRLAEADADAALAVADDDERGEREAPAALHDLGGAVDLDDGLLVVVTRLRRRRPTCSFCLGGGIGSQNSSPALRAASASDFTRPW